MITGLRARLIARRPSGDEGTTLMELMVGMVIMTILLTICTGAVVQMFSSTGKDQGLANTTQQLNTAFVRLDKQVRYASAIDQPTGSLATNNLSVAFQTVNPTGSTCTQLRIQPVAGTTQQQLVERTWAVTSGSATATNLTPWTQLAGGVVTTGPSGSAVPPFSVSTPAGGAVQQLRILVGAVDAQGYAPTQSFSSVVFSALNSGATSTAVTGGTPSAACAQSGI